MSLVDRLKKYTSAEAKEKRKRERAEKVVHKISAQAGRVKLATRRMEIRAELAEARAKLSLAKAKEYEAEAKRRRAEREMKGEGFLGNLARELRGSPKRKTTRRK